MNARHLLLALCLLPALHAHAAEHFCGQGKPHPIDQALARAAERSSGVTMDLADAQGAAWAAWDKELNRLYAALQKAAGPERRETLRAAQRAWLAYDKAQALWDAALHADEGTSAALNTGGASLVRRRARVCDLQSALDGLQP